MKFLGRIDRIDNVTGGVELIDYKMRGNMKHRALKTRFSDLGNKEADLQLPIYILAAEEALGLKVKSVSLIPLDFKNSNPEKIRFDVIKGECYTIKDANSTKRCVINRYLPIKSRNLIASYESVRNLWRHWFLERFILLNRLLYLIK